MVKVALCGDGGDELFLGYEWYWQHRTRGRAFRLRQALRGGPFRDHIEGIQIFKPEERQSLWNGRLPGNSEFVERGLSHTRLSAEARINLFDLTVYLPGQLMVKADRAGMMNSLEVRAPLLDHRLAELAFALPVAYKTNHASGKRLLKDLLSEFMPADFVNRKKQGFGAPVRIWLKTICQPLIRDLFANPDAAVYGFLDRPSVSRMIERFYATEGSSDYYKIWLLLCLELWLGSRRFPLPPRESVPIH